VSFLVDLSYKRRIFETLLDVSLIVIAWYAAWGLRFGRMDPTDPQFRMMVRTLPIVVAVKIGVFLASGVYRGLWRYVSVHDLMGIARAVTIASVISACAIVLSYQEHLFSRRVLMMDLLFLLVLMAGSRAAFRIARRLVPIPRSAKGTPVLIYGAGDAGELLLREIFNNPDLGYLPVGLVDDDPRKTGKVIHGLRVYAGESLPTVCESLRVQEVLISTSKLLPGRLARVTEQCDAIGLPLRQMRIELARLNAWDHDPLMDERIVIRDQRPRIRPHGSTYVVEVSPLLDAKQTHEV
jgi:UDP-GlcNAc:undecaprenyl-phosphate GlcNAc-1-phosphate transferase